MRSCTKKKSKKDRALFNFRTFQDLKKSTTSLDNKLTQLAILLEYEFHWGVDFKRRTIKVTGEIDENTYDIVDGSLTEMEAQSKADVIIKINSPGGCSYQAMAIRSRMRESSCKIITKGYGHIMSAATILLASGTRRREIAEEAFFMWHEASYNMSGRHSENKVQVNQAEKEELYWAKKMGEITKKDQQWWLKHGRGKDAYFNAEQLITLGVADEIF